MKLTVLVLMAMVALMIITFLFINCGFIFEVYAQPVKPIIGVKAMSLGKYNGLGFAKKEAMLSLGVHEKLA